MYYFVYNNNENGWRKGLIFAGIVNSPNIVRITIPISATQHLLGKF